MCSLVTELHSIAYILTKLGINMNNKINYIEFKATDLNEIKKFYSEVFDWKFKDFGTSYTAFSNSGLEGGFDKSDDPISNGVLVVLYHNDLPAILESIKSNNGTISKKIFSFPGGKRFHFIDPSGNELAVWSDK